MARFVIALGLTVSCLTCVSVMGADEVPHVVAYGSATIDVVPDQMVWSLKLENKGKLLEEVAERHVLIVQSVLDFLRESGIEKTDVQSSDMEFGDNWEYRKDVRVKVGYSAASTQTFTVKDTEKYKSLWLGLAKIDGVSVDKVGYDHSQRIAYQNESRQKALLAAKEKAEAMAKVLGAQIGEPLAIEERDAGAGYMRSDRPVMNYIRLQEPPGVTYASEGLAAGKFPIWTRVEVTFRLIAAGK